MAPMGGKMPKSSRVKAVFTTHINADLAEKVRDAVYWTPGITISGLAEEALDRIITEMEQERGEPFPKRAGELRRGWPTRAKEISPQEGNGQTKDVTK